MLNLAHDPTKVICVGMSGCGKTLYSNDWILRSRYRYYFVFDHDGQFSQRHKSAAPQRLARLLNPAFTRDEMFAQLQSQRFVIFDPSEKFADPQKAIDWFACWAYKMSERLAGPKLFYTDEIQDVCGTNRVPFWVRKVLVSGRTKSLDFIGCSLQYNMIHNAIRGQATTTVAFKSQEHLALKELGARGFAPHEIGALEPGKFVLKNHRTGADQRGKVF